MFSIIVSFLSIIYASNAGIATFYGNNDPTGNACGYSSVSWSSFPWGYYAAIGSSLWNNGYGCGGCYRITCTGGGNGCSCTSTPSIIVQAMDWCPECSSDHFDLSLGSMSAIVTNPGVCGIADINIERVNCDYTNNIKIRNKEGTSQWWYGFHVDDVAGYGAISSIKIANNGGSFNDGKYCDKSGGSSFWLCNAQGSLWNPPLSVQFTDDNGRTLEAYNCITDVNGGSAFDCGVNFGSIGGSSPNPSPTPQPVDTGNNGIIIQNWSSTQDWYLTFALSNIDTSCGDSISNVQIWSKITNQWINYMHHYTESGGVERYAFDHEGRAYSELLPISILISTSWGNPITLTDIITDINPNTIFSTSQQMC